MEIDTKGDKCCTKECNIIEIDGTHVCNQCGIVQDMMCLEYRISYRHTTWMNPLLLEVCHRLEIDSTTENDAINIYNDTILRYPSLRKNIIIPTSVYIAAKKNFVPRTIKEISAVSGVSVKNIGHYERFIFHKYIPTKPVEYIYRFGKKLNMSCKEIMKIEKSIRLLGNSNKIQNPVLLCALFLYRSLKEVGNSLIQIQDVTGIPASTIKNAYKKEFKK